MSGPPDPKPVRRTRNHARRIIDPDASRQTLRRWPVCVACRARATNSHHVLGKGQGGDDVEENLVALCGSGAAGCHGALHGNPHVDRNGRRWTGDDVRQAIGAHIFLDRTDVTAYIYEKLGGVAGLDFFARRYFVADVLGEVAYRLDAAGQAAALAHFSRRHT